MYIRAHDTHTHAPRRTHTAHRTQHNAFTPLRDTTFCTAKINYFTTQKRTYTRAHTAQRTQHNADAPVRDNTFCIT